MKILKKIFSRMALMLLLIFLQIIAITAGVVLLIITWWPFAIEFTLIEIIVLLLIINRRGPSELKIPWIVVVLLLPVLGLLLYVFFANHGLKPKYRKVMIESQKESKRFFDSENDVLKEIVKEEPKYSASFEYLSRVLRFTPTKGVGSHTLKKN